MLDIDQMSSQEIYELLRKVGYGHLFGDMSSRMSWAS